jgi:hypothetical protein
MHHFALHDELCAVNRVCKADSLTVDPSFMSLLVSGVVTDNVTICAKAAKALHLPLM